MFYYVLFWICIFGLCLGSFYNVVILRSLSDESIVFPGSKCPKCGHKLFWWHNIPILSYLLLRGKCYFCKEKISLQYPIIEFITMLLFASAYIKFGISLKTLFVIIWMSLFLIMTATDLKEKLVDCNLAIAAAITGVLYNGIFYGWKGVLYSVLGTIAACLILEIVARLGYLFAKTRAMGEADTYVAGALGAIFGIKTIIPVLLSGLIASMIFIVPVFLYNRFKQNDKLTCVLSFLFILTILEYTLLTQNILSYVSLLFAGILLAYRILKTIGNTTNLNFLPYVPALAFGFLWFIFIL